MAPINSSLEFEILIFPKNVLRKYLQMIQSKNISKTVLNKTSHIKTHIEASLSHKIDINKSIGIIAISWNNSIPNTFCPYSLFISRVSFNIFNTIAVDDKLNQAHMMIEVFVSNHNQNLDTR